MIEGKVVAVIIPAFNEQFSVDKVVQDIPRPAVDQVIVVNNNSSDKTAETARQAGAIVLDEARQGYGYACLKGMHYLQTLPAKQQPDIIVFLDADYSDYPEELPTVVAPLLTHYDMVIGSRVLGPKEKGSMLPQQIFGNWLATRLIKLFYGARFTDLGPFRAIWWNKLLALDMRDKTYGWTVEMQVKAAKRGYRCTEVPVQYRKRIGKSKVTGTIKGTIGASYKILSTIFTNIFVSHE